MNSKELTGLQVISARSGERTGTVAHAYLDPAAKRIAGFAVHAGGGLFSPESEPLVDAREIQALGPDALVIDDLSATSGDAVTQQYGALIPLDGLMGRSVLTKNGTAFGKVASVEFDPKSLKLQGVETSPGFFKSNRTIPLSQVTTIGPDYVIVVDAVLADSGDG